MFDDIGEAHTKVDDDHQKNSNHSNKESYHEKGSDVDPHAVTNQQNIHLNDVDSNPFGLASLI